MIYCRSLALKNHYPDHYSFRQKRYQIECDTIYVYIFMHIIVFFRLNVSVHLFKLRIILLTIDDQPMKRRFHGVPVFLPGVCVCVCVCLCVCVLRSAWGSPSMCV